MAERIFYLDYDNGSDSEDTPLGWWKAAYTGGTAPAPGAGELSTQGASSAYLTIAPTLTGGDWALGTAAGVLYFYGKSGTFAAGEISFAGGGHADIAGDLGYSSWKTITSGATSARLAGDLPVTVRIAKSRIPVLLGTATWTDRSKTVSLASGSGTANVDRCEVAWTPVHGAVYRTTSGVREGSYMMRITEDAVPVADEVQAYYPTGTLDLSTYQKLSFWIKPITTAVLADRFVLKLYTTADASGVACDEFSIPALPAKDKWHVMTIARTGDGDLNGSVKSIALVNGSTPPTASQQVYIDNIIACTTEGLNLSSIISVTSTEQGGEDVWYGLEWINGSSLGLDNGGGRSNAEITPTTGMGWSGTTGTYPTYYRQTTKTSMASTEGVAIQVVQASGTSLTTRIAFEGGYDPSTNQQIGETCFDGQNFCGYGLQLSAKHFIRINRINMLRYYYGWQIASACNSFDVGNAWISDCAANAAVFDGDVNTTIERFDVVNCHEAALYCYQRTKNMKVQHIGRLTGLYNGAGISLTGRNIEIDQVDRIGNFTVGSSGNYAYGVYLNGVNDVYINSIGILEYCRWGVYSQGSYDSHIYSIPIVRGNTYDVYQAYGKVYIRNMGLNPVAPTVTTELTTESRIYLHNYLLSGNHRVLASYAYIDSTSTAGERHVDSGLAWKFYVTNVLRNSAFPLRERIASFPVNSSGQVTVKCWVKRSTANVAAKIMVPKGRLAGVTTETSSALATTTDWEELTLTILPTEAGVVEVFGYVYCVSGTGNVLFHDMTISQA